MEKVMNSSEVAGIDAGIGLLCDIELDATLQFGSRDMPLREVLELGPGDVVELDRTCLNLSIWSSETESWRGGGSDSQR